MNNVDIVEILINVGRCTKVTKGGRTLSFSAIVVVGDKNGRVGYGLGKASEIIDAKSKAAEKAKKNMYKIPLKNGKTLYHDIYYKYCSSKIVLRSAHEGKGVIAGGPIRAICMAAGIQNIVSKSLGSNNVHNVTKATIEGLKTTKTPKMISNMKFSKHISQIAK